MDEPPPPPPPPPLLPDEDLPPPPPYKPPPEQSTLALVPDDLAVNDLDALGHLQAGGGQLGHHGVTKLDGDRVQEGDGGHQTLTTASLRQRNRLRL